MADLKLSGVQKYYGGVHAVKGVDLEIPSSEFAVLVGPSGCGKSTLLRCIAGLEDVDHGSISIAGKDVTGARPRDRDIAMVFQSYALYPYMSVFENIAFSLRARKMGEAEINKRVNNAAELLGIGAYLKRRPRELSGGQRQRVAIGRAIVRDASIYLFDEPLSNLDAQLRDDMRVEIKRLHQEMKRTMIYVTHDQIEAMTLADRIILLKEGKIEQAGTPLDLFDNPSSRFVAGFMGSPRMNFIPTVISRNELKIGARALALPKGARAANAEGDVILGIRPQHISRAPSAAAGNMFVIDAVVDVAQITGTRALVSVKIDNQPMIADLEMGSDCVAGARIKLAFDLRHVFLFDPQTGKAMRLG